MSISNLETIINGIIEALVGVITIVIGGGHYEISIDRRNSVHRRNSAHRRNSVHKFIRVESETPWGARRQLERWQPAVHTLTQVTQALHPLAAWQVVGDQLRMSVM